MLINLTDYFKVHGKASTLKVQYEPDAYETSEFSYKVVSKDDIDFKVENISDDQVHLTADFSINLQMNCDRCLKDVEEKIDVSIDTVLIEPDGFHEIDEEEQGIFMEGYELDTTKLIENELIMSLPMKILCKEDCKGLCLKCGSNLNDGDCGCDRFVPDPRMAAIQDIFDAYNKEV